MAARGEDLRRAVDDARPRIQEARRARRMMVASFGAASGVLALLASLDPPRPNAPATALVPAPPIVVPPVTVTRSTPQVVTVPLAFPPDDPRDCPVPVVPDRPIGRARPPSLAWQDDAIDGASARMPIDAVAAAARAPVIAVLAKGQVWASTDDGAHFARVLASAGLVDTIAVDADGVIYAATGTRIGARVRGRETWVAHPDVPVGPGASPGASAGAFVANGARVLWIGDHHVGHARAGRWRFEDVGDQRFDDLIGGQGWDDVIYRGAHVQDMCGLDDYVTARLGASGQLIGASFHAGGPGPTLGVVADTGGSWRYAVSCAPPVDSDEDAPPCGPVGEVEQARALLVAQVSPTIGGRALFVEHGVLAELCGLRARALAHGFGDWPIAAVDGGGRPLVLERGRLWRWSPRFGWRELFAGPPDGDSDGDADI